MTLQYIPFHYIYTYRLRKTHMSSPKHIRANKSLVSVDSRWQPKRLGLSVSPLDAIPRRPPQLSNSPRQRCQRGSRVRMWRWRPSLMSICSMYERFTSSTAQGGGGSFKNRKPIGELGCCEWGMAERSHWWTERCLRSPLFLSLSLTIYLPTSLSSMYLSIYRSIYLSLSLFHLITYLPIYLSTYLSIYPSIYLSISLSPFHLSICLPVWLSIYLSISPSIDLLLL